MQDDTTDVKDIFRPQALSRLASADDLDRYIKVTRPSGWVALLASLSLMVGIGIWSVTGTIPTTKSFTGILSGRDVVCWVDEATFERVRQGNVSARVANVNSTEVMHDDIPMSSAEVIQYLGSDYLSTVATTFDWNYLLFITLEGDVPQSDRVDDQYEDSLTTERVVPVEITTSEIRPIDLLLGRG